MKKGLALTAPGITLILPLESFPLAECHISNWSFLIILSKCIDRFGQLIRLFVTHKLLMRILLPSLCLLVCRAARKQRDSGRRPWSTDIRDWSAKLPTSRVRIRTKMKRIRCRMLIKTWEENTRWDHSGRQTLASALKIVLRIPNSYIFILCQVYRYELSCSPMVTCVDTSKPSAVCA